MPAEEREPVPGASRRAVLAGALALPLVATPGAMSLPVPALMARYLAWLEREAEAVRSHDGWGGLLLNGFHVHDPAVRTGPAASAEVASRVLKAAGVTTMGGGPLPSLVQGAREPASEGGRRVAMWARKAEHFWRRADDPAFDERDTYRLVQIAHGYEERVLAAQPTSTSIAAEKLRVLARVADHELAEEQSVILRDLASFIEARA